MTKYSIDDQINAMTTLIASLLQTLNERSIMTDEEIRTVVQNAASMCGKSPAGAGARSYLEEVYLQHFR